MCLTSLVFLQLTLYTSCPSIQFLVFHEVASQECGNKKQKHWKEYHYFHSFCSHINQEVCNFSLLNLNFQCSLTLFRMSFFEAPHGWVGGKKGPPPLSKSCHTYPTMMKLGTVIPYPKKIQKYINHVTHLLSSADISIFSPEISKYWYIKKYRYRLYFDT